MQNFIRVLANSTKQEKEKRPDWKGRSKTVFVHSEHGRLYRKSCVIYKIIKLLVLRNELSKVAGYKNNIQILIVYFHILGMINWILKILKQHHL